MNDKIAKILVIGVGLILLLVIISSCVPSKSIPIIDAPNPIPLTADEVDEFGSVGRQDTDFASPISMDISMVSSDKWLTVTDRINKNFVRFNLNRLDEISENESEVLKGTFIDYETDGVPITISTDNEGNIYSVSQLVDEDNIQRIKLLKYGLDTDGQPDTNKTWDYLVYPVFYTDEQLYYEDKYYNTNFAHITKLEVVNPNNLFMTIHSSYTFHYKDVTRAVFPEANPYDRAERNLRQILNIDLSTGVPPESPLNIWTDTYQYFDYVYEEDDEGYIGVAANIGDPLNDSIINIYTIYDAPIDSENIFVFYIDNYCIKEERINDDGVPVQTRVGKGIMKIKSFNASTGNPVKEYSFIGNDSVTMEDENGDTYIPIPEIPLPPIDDINNEDNEYNFYYRGWLSDANSIALDPSGDNLFVLKFNQGYVMWFERDDVNDRYQFQKTIDIRVVLETLSNITSDDIEYYKLRKPMDLEYYEEGSNQYIMILDTDNSRLVRVKIN